MNITAQHLIIKGITRSGKPFRPSDWAERLSGIFSTMGKDNRMSYSPHVRPVTLEGVKCVVVGKQLETVDPDAYRFLLGFARDNDLELEEGEAWLAQHQAVPLAS